MEQSIFRKASLDRVSSPEQLNDYIRVSNPSVWVVLAAVIVLLGAFFVWSIWGHIPTTLTANGVAQNGVITCYVPSGEEAALSAGLSARVGQVEGSVREVSPAPLSYEEAAAAYESDYTVHALDLSEWNTVITVEADVPDGLQQVTIVTDSVQPVSFLLNTK